MVRSEAAGGEAQGRRVAAVFTTNKMNSASRAAAAASSAAGAAAAARLSALMAGSATQTRGAEVVRCAWQAVLGASGTR